MGQPEGAHYQMAGSGLNGKRPELRRVLSDSSAMVIVVEHRHWLARFGARHLDAALVAHGRRLAVTDRARRRMTWCGR